MTATVPEHYADDGHWCPRGGVATATGHCDRGCDHAEHYANDGHPECAEETP